MRGQDNTENIVIKKVHKQANKKISNGCRDVQRIGLQSTQTLVSKVHKQGALGTSSQASLHQWLHDNYSRIIMLINSGI